MNAQEIFKILNNIDDFGLRLRLAITPESGLILDEIYRQASGIMPCKNYPGSADREFWLWTERGSYEEFKNAFRKRFTYLNVEQMDSYLNGNKNAGVFNGEKARETWQAYFPEKTVWFRLYLAEQDGSRGVFLNGKCIASTQKGMPENVDCRPLLRWILAAEKKCVNMIREGSYNDFIAENLPYWHRSGVVEMNTYWKYVPEDKERLFGKINPDELTEFLIWDKNEEIGWPVMTSGDYFRICDTLYDLLDLKTKYPIIKRMADGVPVPPREYYKVYGDNYSSSESLLQLDERSGDAFLDYVRDNKGDHHVWAVCQVPYIHLYPVISRNKLYVSLSFDHKTDEYALLVHLALELRKKGLPVLKPTEIEERMSGKQMVEILPYDDKFDWEYSCQAGIKTSESRRLPMPCCAELIKEIQWFPTKNWAAAHT